ncbi:hypothetical protein [Methanosarcina sp. WWM596]|nr:hypothetical protein [Methanosarcina sp. WWM596]
MLVTLILFASGCSQKAPENETKKVVNESENLTKKAENIGENLTKKT